MTDYRPIINSAEFTIPSLEKRVAELERQAALYKTALQWIANSKQQTWGAPTATQVAKAALNKQP